MLKIIAYLQYVIPQHALTSLMGWLARRRSPWFKNWMIHFFIRRYKVDMEAALIPNPEEYIDFNHFFIRQLKPDIRPITAGAQDIASPVDGCLAQIGRIDRNRLIQAKGFDYTLTSLLGRHQSLVSCFADGSFATLYLAPRDYHRVHMPLTGKLVKSFFIPGKLFSVNAVTSETIPDLYTRNERLITIFETAAGPMAVILIGAMVVGSIQTVWMDQPARIMPVDTPIPLDFQLNKGDELGHFKMGSTVILLFGKGKATWSMSALQSVQYGQLIGHFS